jgi:hypothetical protein
MKQIKPETSPPTIYCDAKQLAVDYQTAKIQINKAFQKAALGLWIVCIKYCSKLFLCVLYLDKTT